MPGTTSEGLPYPLGSEPFADGADAIQALAEAIPGLTRAYLLAYSVGGQNINNNTLTPVDINMVDEQSSHWALTGTPGVAIYTGPDILALITGQVVFEDMITNVGYREASIGIGADPVLWTTRVMAVDSMSQRTAVQVTGIARLVSGIGVVLRCRHTQGVDTFVNGFPDNKLQIVELARLS